MNYNLKIIVIVPPQSIAVDNIDINTIIVSMIGYRLYTSILIGSMVFLYWVVFYR